MLPDSSLVGHETQAERGTVNADDVRQFADAIGDANPIYREAEAARAAGFSDIPAPPTFVTRFRVPFEEAGLDVQRMQVLHGEQEYSFVRPLVVGESLSVRHRIATIREMRGMAIMAIEQLCDAESGERILTGKATVIVREGTSDAGGATAPAGKAPKVPTGEQIPALEKHVTQEQVNAYADVSGDHNPIHVDPEAARAVGLDGTIAHGMLSMAFVGQLVTDWATSTAASGGYLSRLRVRFQGMVRPGDTVTCRCALGARDDHKQAVDVWMENQRGERVLTGDADVTLGG